jgi:hypothetical protein
MSYLPFTRTVLNSVFSSLDSQPDARIRKAILHMNQGSLFIYRILVERISGKVAGMKELIRITQKSQPGFPITIGTGWLYNALIVLISAFA